MTTRARAIHLKQQPLLWIQSDTGVYGIRLFIILFKIRLAVNELIHVLLYFVYIFLFNPKLVLTHPCSSALPSSGCRRRLHIAYTLLCTAESALHILTHCSPLQNLHCRILHIACTGALHCRICTAWYIIVILEFRRPSVSRKRPQRLTHYPTANTLSKG